MHQQLRNNHVRGDALGPCNRPYSVDAASGEGASQHCPKPARCAADEFKPSSGEEEDEESEEDDESDFDEEEDEDDDDDEEAEVDSDEEEGKDWDELEREAAR